MKNKGQEELHNITKEEMEILLQGKSFKEIGEIYGISDKVVSRVLKDKFKMFKLNRKHHKKDYVENERMVLDAHGKVPFSYNEDDYGKNENKINQMITKEGLLVFEGNAPILKQRNESSEVVKNYVNVMLENKQRLKFIKNNGSKSIH